MGQGEGVFVVELFGIAGEVLVGIPKAVGATGMGIEGVPIPVGVVGAPVEEEGLVLLDESPTLLAHPDIVATGWG